MTTYYINPATGNDAADGLTWGTAWRTLLNGATFARLGQTDSDEIRIAKSPDPVSIGNVTWTDGSRTITISGLTNQLIDNGKTGWVQTAGTLTYNATHARTTGAAMQIAMSTVNGKSAHKQITTLNMSAASRLTFWVNFGTGVNYTAGCPVQIDLCSDTAGNTPVVRCTLPRYFYPANYWVPITITADAGFDFANATAIQSITVRTSAAVTNTIRFDNFQAARGANDTTSLVLTDLVAKNDGKGRFYSITAIEGTVVDITAVASRNTGLPNPATQTETFFYDIAGTETVATVKRWGFDTAIDVPATAATSAVGALNYTNITNFPETKTYIGGVNPATDVVDGETWFDGVTGFGNGLQQTNFTDASYDVSNIGVVRYNNGILINMAANTTWNNISVVAVDNQWLSTSVNSGGFTVDRYVKFEINIKWLRMAFGGNLASSNHVGMFIPLKGPRPVIKFQNIHSSALSIASVIFSQVGGSNPTYVLDFEVQDTIVFPITPFFRLAGMDTNIVINNSYFTGAVAGFFGGIFGDTHAKNVTFTGQQRLRTNANSRLLGPLPPETPVIVRFGPSASIVNFGAASSLYALSGSSTAFGGTYDATKIRVFVYNKPATLALNDSPTTSGTTVGELVSNNHNNVAGDNRIYNIQHVNTYWRQQQATTFTGPNAWEIDYSNGWGTTRLATEGRIPATLRLGDVAVKGGSPVTVTLRCRRSITNLAGGFVVTNTSMYPDVLTQNVASTRTTSTNEWELLSATFTPTENTVVTIRAEVYPVTPVATATSVFFDDLQITQD